MKNKFPLTLVCTMFAVITLVFSGAIIAGCTADGRFDPSHLDDLRQSVVDTRKATTQAIADTQKEISTYPQNDPARKVLEGNLAKLQANLDKSEVYLQKFDKAIAAVNSGDSAALRDLVTGIPYGGLVLSVGGLGWSLYQRWQAKKALEQVVTGVETILPEKTDEQKTLLTMVQDASTRKMVDHIKSKTVLPQRAVARVVEDGTKQVWLEKPRGRAKDVSAGK